MRIPRILGCSLASLLLIPAGIALADGPPSKSDSSNTSKAVSAPSRRPRNQGLF